MTLVEPLLWIGIVIWMEITILNFISVVMLALSMKTIKEELKDQREKCREN